MKMYEINRWKDSAGESWNWNEESVKKSGVLYFYVTTEQKEYLESHTDEIDGWCERTIGETPVAIRFEEDWDSNSNEACYTCECYFEKWYYNGELYKLIKEFHLDDERGYAWCDFDRLTEIAEDYEIEEIDPDSFEKEYTVGSDICKKLGENYTCSYSEDVMSFWDKTRWDLKDDQFVEI